MGLARVIVEYFTFRSKALPIARRVDNGAMVSVTEFLGIGIVASARTGEASPKGASVQGRIAQPITA
jgi:hypothetical protein